jgi:hypothetical protein
MNPWWWPHEGSKHVGLINKILQYRIYENIECFLLDLIIDSAWYDKYQTERGGVIKQFTEWKEFRAFGRHVAAMCSDWITSACFCQNSLKCKLIAVQLTRLACEINTRIRANTSDGVLERLPVSQPTQELTAFEVTQNFGTPCSQELIPILRRVIHFYSFTTNFIRILPSVRS